MSHQMQFHGQGFSQEQQRTSVNVSQPPGGKSSIFFGDEPKQAPPQRAKGGIGSSYQVGYQQAFEQRDLNKRDYPPPQRDFAQRDSLQWPSYQQKDEFQAKPKQYSGYSPAKQSYQYDGIGSQPLSKQQYGYQPQSDVVFGQKVQSGMNSGPTTGQNSVKVSNPPGGKSSIQLF